MAIALIDSSSWIHSLRPDGDPSVAGRVRALIESGEAAWCPMVRLELWGGAQGRHEKDVLREMERSLIDLPIDDEVWERACLLMTRARQRGKTVPATDALIVACARRHGVGVEHADRHFALLMALE